MPATTIATTATTKQVKKSQKRREKPVWPYPDIVKMAWHPKGYWCKKIGGKVRSFGRDAGRALDRWRREAPVWDSGRIPRTRRIAYCDCPSVSEIASEYLHATEGRVQAGELTTLTWQEYYSYCERFVRFLGVHRRADDVMPEDFAQLRASFAEKAGPHTVSKLVSVTRMVFKYAHDQGLLDQPVRFGKDFRRAGALAVRRAKRAAGKRMLFTPEEIRGAYAHGLKTSRADLSAMILLAFNGAMGQADVARLTPASCDLDAEIPALEYDRHKTEVRRTITLWPETVDLLRRAIDPKRPREPIFKTRFGELWVRQKTVNGSNGMIRFTNIDSLGPAFAKLCGQAGLTGCPSFYGLRHTAATIADEAGDPHAVHRLRGHSLPGMSDVYVERITRERIKKITDHLREWFFGGWREPWPQSK